jgi:hypothetical protein
VIVFDLFLELVPIQRRCLVRVVRSVRNGDGREYTPWGARETNHTVNFIPPARPFVARRATDDLYVAVKVLLDALAHAGARAFDGEESAGVGVP